MKSKVIILGAGIAGIGAAYKLKGDCVVYEAMENIGGHCSNFVVDGFRFDYAVHLSFTKNKFVRSIFDQVEYYTHFPLAKNYSDGYWTKHPMQNNLFPLPIQEKIDVIIGFVNRDITDNPTNYSEWLKSKYGNYFSIKYPERYTKKYWGYDASYLTTNWIENRMYTPALQEMLYGAFTEKTPNTYYTKEMRYPKKGGYLSFFNHLCGNIDIRTNHRAERIDIEKKSVKFSNGENVEYDRLVSSIPLPDLVGMLENVPEDIRQATSKLEATSLVLVSVGFKGLIDIPSLWFYIYDEDISFARAYSPSKKSPDNVPNGKSSLQFEFYRLRRGELTIEEVHYYENQAVGALEKLNIAKRYDIEVMDVRTTAYANVIFKPLMEKNRKVVRDYLERIGIETIGRYGEWEYFWSDQSFLSGYGIRE